MSALYVNSLPQAQSGVYAEKIPSPATVTPSGTGVAMILGQFPWGPPNVRNYPSGRGAFTALYNPAGSDRTNSAYLCTIKKGWPVLGAVRVCGPTAAAATATLASSTPTNLLTVTAAYPGTLGNSLVLTVGPAGDGNTNHFRLTVTLSGASGTTSEVYDNLNVSGVGADVLPPAINGTLNGTSVLLASIVKLAAGIPAPGNTTMGGGTSGVVAALEYVGTAGAGDYGLALLESDKVVNNVFFDDPGNALRAAANAGMLAHVTLMGGDRIGYINGPSGQTIAAAQTDVGNYRSPWLCYVDPWAYILDDVTGTPRLAPGAPWAASLASQMPASLSLAWRQVGGPLMSGISALEFDRGSGAGANTAAGITTIDANPNGGYYFEQDVNTSLISGQTDLLSSRMDSFLGRSVKSSWDPYVNAPNIGFFQQDLINSLQQFLDRLVANSKSNPAVLAFIAGFTPPDASMNTPASIAAGQFVVSNKVRYGSSMKNLVYALQSGVGVTVSSS